MRLYFDPGTGAPLFTLAPVGDMPRWPAGSWIEIDAVPEGELTDWRVVDGELVRVSIEGTRASAIATINAAAAHVRRLYITELPGQELIYQEKRAEAVAYLADADPDLADYPFIAAEIGATAPTAHEVAQVYVNMAALLRAAGAALEHVRLGAIAGVEAAETEAEIAGTLTAFDQAIGQLQ